ncbi:MAG: lipopolysaccharide biosynthesis protein [Bacteroidota bacterium]|nr:lipopolysaccharide biosynthesis protein [Bacteroidota bacterium]
MTSTIKKKAVKGVVWTITEKFGVQGIRFVLGIVLARLLTPEDFGLVGMVTVFFTLAQVFVESGFGQAYIQKKTVTEIDANTVFYTNLVISIIVYAILWLTAPYIARFYNQMELIEITRILGLVIIINSFVIIQISQITRNVNFKKKAKITLISVLISGLAGVISAIYGLGVWSLVIQQMTNRLLFAIILWITSKWKPSLNFSFKSLKSMFSFGSWILLSGIIRKFFDNIYILAIGKFFPASAVGFYTKAKQFNSKASQELSNAVGVVSFPIFSVWQEDKIKLQNGMRKFLKHTMIFVMPLMVVLIVVAEPFVILLLKEKWAPMIPYLQLLCLAGLLYPLHSVNIEVLKAQGKSKINFKLNIIKNILRIVNILITYRWGVLYIIFGEVIVSIISLIINTYYTKKFINYGLFDQFKDIYIIILGALIASITGYIISSLFINLWYILFAGTLATLSIYIVFQYIFNNKFFIETIRLKDNFYN